MTESSDSKKGDPLQEYKKEFGKFPDIFDFLREPGPCSQIFHLTQPLSDEIQAAVMKAFDGGSINSPEGHWWGTRTEEDDPSHPRNRTIKPDGTIYIEGVDYTEGRFSTFLSISGDRKFVEVDRAWNGIRIRRVLEAEGIEFKTK